MLTKKQIKLAAKLWAYRRLCSTIIDPIEGNENFSEEESELISDEIYRIGDRLKGNYPSFSSYEEIIDYVKSL